MTIDVTEIPLKKISFGSTFSIGSNGLGEYTHGFFKYPCKFIPHIPRWAIKKYSTRDNGAVLDPFSGSGTTLVEAVLQNKDAFGIDFDPFSRILSKVKSTPLSKKQLKTLNEQVPDLIKTIKESSKAVPLINFPNANLWFNKKNLTDLSRVKNTILEFSKKLGDEDIEKFLFICLAAILRKTSNADDQSPKPYVSGKIKKIPASVIPTFETRAYKHIEKMECFSKNTKDKHGEIIGNDARKIDLKEIKKYTDYGINLSVTSPPYINAFDIVRTFKIEDFVLDLIKKEELSELKRKQIGTETISASEYNEDPVSMINSRLDLITKKIFENDHRRAHIVNKFFKDMKLNFQEMYNCLNNGGVYCIVVGDSKIRNIVVPTHEILIDIGKEIGFKLDNLFSYVIKNHYLRFPRQGRGGFIQKDWIIVLEK